MVSGRPRPRWTSPCSTGGGRRANTPPPPPSGPLPPPRPPPPPPPAAPGKRARGGDPFPVLKIKVGLETDEATIAAVRSVTDKPLRVDANEGWKDREVAVRKIEWLAT